MDIEKNRYFLLVNEIGLFPEIIPHTVQMIEQIMNALILSSKSNLQIAINSVMVIESYSNDLIKLNYLVALDKLKPILLNFNIEIAQGEEVRGSYPLYNKKKYYWDIGKQAAINTEFALEKKVSYNGKKITWENTYIDWVDQIIANDRDAILHNSTDEFLFHTLAPKTIKYFIKTRDLILSETIKFAKECKENIEIKKSQVQ